MADYHHRSDLVRIANMAMKERGLEPEFSKEAVKQLTSISGPGRDTSTAIRDLRDLLWCSIDNDDSLDLDQLTVAQVQDNGIVHILVAIADVDALVKKDSAIDAHAHQNTCSVYTSARIFPMLPERLSTNLTSLNANEDRLALVTEMLFHNDGSMTESSVYRALVRNQAKLAYDATSAWLNGTASAPAAIERVAGMAEQLRIQDGLAQKLRAKRYEHGSLEFETFQSRAVFEGEKVVGIEVQEHNRARQLIEELMIATNECTAIYLRNKHAASLRRVVRSPERWARIVAVAKELGTELPELPDSRALSAFLAAQHKQDPVRFPDLSLVIIKLMGSGEYILESARDEPVGHFGLAVRDYTHSTAPNRRYPDLITLRMLKAAIAGELSPYGKSELGELARHCTQQEDAARKVERRLRKSEAALVLEKRLGQNFDGIITGSGSGGIWVRIFSPHAEGKIIKGAQQLAVGDKVQVQLVSVSVEHGFIDFSLIATSHRRF